MAKVKGRRSSGATATATEGDAPTKDSNTGTDVFPQLEEGAFAGLRQRIEQKLKDSAAKQKPKNNKSKAVSTDAAKTTKDTAPKPAPKRADNERNKDNKGKKRDRNGEVIAGEEKKEKGKPSADQNAILRHEILALGGTEEDFDLVDGVDSESEVEDVKKSKDKTEEDSLRKELSGMLAAAGQIAPPDIESEDEEEEDDEEDDDVENEGSDGGMDDDTSDAEDVPAVSTSKKSKDSTKQENPKMDNAENAFPKEYSKLVVPPRSDWYATELPTISAKEANTLPRHLVDRIYNYAVSLLEQDNAMYAEAQQASSSSSHKFYTTIMSTGTLSDKISAMTLAVQESPLHNTKSLENLIVLGKKRSRAQAVEVLRSLKDMFAQGTLLPGDRRLRAFSNQPSLIAAFQGTGSKWSEGSPLPNGLQKRHLIVWAFEHLLKEQFFEVLKILEVWCNDEIEFSRSRAVSYVYELLKEKPEQESNLLRMLVNKLGDKAKKIASRASYLLLQLEQAHPLMKPTIIVAVEEVLFRPGQSQHAKYYAVITLNQSVLSLKEEEVALKLLDIYFSLFVALLKPTKGGHHPPGKKHGKYRKKKNGKDDEAKGQAQTEEVQDKLTSAVLTGVNRAYPFTSSDSQRVGKHIDTLFRITHSSNFNTSIQALMLIQQLTSTHQVAADRFYRTLYESLLDPRVATSSKQSLYLNLLFKALKNDVNVRRVKAFVKRIVQVLGMHQPAFICGVFYLVRELESSFASLQSLYDQPEDNESDDEEVFRDVPDEDDEPQVPVEAVETKPQKPSNRYDPRKRDPEHSNADRTCLWELLPFVSHFHPSVSVNADNLLDHNTMSGKPDLTIHTLTHFLDRFVYRTPKAAAVTRGASIMQPLAGSDAQDRLVAGVKQIQHVPLNSEAFWKKKSEDVAVEDVFFHEYFSRIGKDKDKSQKKKKDDVDRDDEDAEDLSDAESEVWKALVDSRPELEGAESDDDLDLDDLESEYDKDEDEEDAGSGDDEVIFNDESDDEEMAEFDEEDEPVFDKEPAVKSKAKKAQEEVSDDDFDMDVSDDEAFVDSDEEFELPSDVELEGGAEPAKDDKQSERKKRRKLKHLPTFASADDYAALLAGEDDGITDHEQIVQAEADSFVGRQYEDDRCAARALIGRIPALEAKSEPLKMLYVRDSTGKVFNADPFFEMMSERNGFGVLTLERKVFLDTIYEHLPDKSHIRTGTRVVDVIDNDDGVIVKLEDGSTEEGDILIGCDGVHSTVRQLMWRCADSEITEAEKGYMHWICSRDFSILIISQPDQTYFFVSWKMAQQMIWPTKGRWSAEEVEEAAASVLDHPITDSMTFGDLWKTKTRAHLLGLEEGLLKHWNFRRVALVGDSAHKITPNFALGANCALESSAALLNELVYLIKNTPPATRPSQEAITGAFNRYQEKRMPRMQRAYDASCLLTRMQAYDGLFNHFMMRVMFPFMVQKAYANKFGDLCAGAPKFEFLPIEYPNPCTIPWKDEIEGNDRPELQQQQQSMIVVGQAMVTKMGQKRNYN
ncbi:hypothetical protein FE257_007544 [Aspergillus nanangensis]|uniref:CCAAT-binding factor domain-containing protein n=1 Tax=Aspergillus nanangensis TaxID=2582783 RepID=A0AAD4CMN2_ASPNN|nr:hypothetical protein FE257_007544 [Aspergillus nanangensis]